MTSTQNLEHAAVLWDHLMDDPAQRGGWADGGESHAYLRPQEGSRWYRMMCRPYSGPPSGEGLRPYPPEAPLCSRCVEMTGLDAKLRLQR